MNGCEITPLTAVGQGETALSYMLPKNLDNAAGFPYFRGRYKSQAAKRFP
jgi:hypothetical protein